jgi:hypothetical protein
MKKLLIGLTLLASMSSFADYDSKIQEEDERMVDRVTARLELAREYESSDCVQSALNEIENEVSKAKVRYGDNFEAYDEQIFREDLQIVARIKTRTCIMLEK